MSTHNIGFYEDLTKIIFELSSNIVKYAPYFFCCPNKPSEISHPYQLVKSIFNFSDVSRLVVFSFSFNIYWNLNQRQQHVASVLGLYTVCLWPTNGMPQAYMSRPHREKNCFRRFRPGLPPGHDRHKLGCTATEDG